MIGNQTRFRAALLDPSLPAPEGLEGAAHQPVGKRFSVYRNNVVISLRQALVTGFPLLRKLLGGTGFDQIADVYLRVHPPTSPVMMFFGEDLPDFLHDFAPVRHLGYLPDCARLDLTLRQSYHAADAAPFDTTTLECPPDQLMQTRLTLAPATCVLRSNWPLYDIWRFNTETDAAKPRAAAQDVLITRPGLDPAPHALPTGAATWFEALEQGQTLAQAQDAALAADSGFDLTICLTLAIGSGAFTTSDKGKSE